MDTLTKGLFPFGLGRVNDESVSKLADSVVQQLEMALAVGLLSDGQRLPNEAELASELGVSTVTLRQALTVLRDKGLIQTRRGRGGGSYVQDSEAASRERAEEQLRAKSTEELRDLGDLAAAVTGSAARLAAVRALPEDIRRLEALVHTLAEGASEDARRRADSRFHIELGVVAQSPQLTTLIVQVQGQMAPLLWSAGDGATDRVLREHGQMVAAVREGDAARALRYAVEHCEHEARVLIDRHLALVAAANKEIA